MLFPTCFYQICVAFCSTFHSLLGQILSGEKFGHYQVFIIAVLSSSTNLKQSLYLNLTVNCGRTSKSLYLIHRYYKNVSYGFHHKDDAFFFINMI